MKIAKTYYQLKDAVTGEPLSALYTSLKNAKRYKANIEKYADGWRAVIVEVHEYITLDTVIATDTASIYPDIFVKHRKEDII